MEYWTRDSKSVFSGRVKIFESMDLIQSNIGKLTALSFTSYIFHGGFCECT
jgi:hypothetical protein